MYEAGKGIKTTPSVPVALYPPYYMQGMPTMVPISPPSLVESKMSMAPSVDNNNISSSQQPSGKHFTPSTQKRQNAIFSTLSFHTYSSC